MNKNIKTREERLPLCPSEDEIHAAKDGEITDSRAYIAELESRTPAAPVVAEGLTKRLREYANASWKFSNILVAKSDLLALLDEADRLAAHPVAGSPAEPKLVLALPDHERRKIVIASDEVIDGERLVCVAIEDAAAEPMPVAGSPAEAHPDDIAVDRFAAAMKAKMAKSRAQGRWGWNDSSVCPAHHLQSLLRNHVGKGDPVDVGNFAMMLFNRGERTAAAEHSLAGARVEKVDTVLWDAVTSQFVNVVKHHPNFKEQVSADFAHKNSSRFYDAADIEAMSKELDILRTRTAAAPMPASEAPWGYAMMRDGVMQGHAGSKAIADSWVNAIAVPLMPCAAPVPASEAASVLHHNFTTHRDSWHDAIVECINTATNSHDHDNAAYWKHELRAYNEAFDSLAAPAAPTDTNQERADFENWYMTHIEGAELGSRDCAARWSTWLARSGGFYKAPSDWKIAPMPWSATAAPTDAKLDGGLSDLWMHEDMAMDETAAVVNLPRKQLQAYYMQARDDLAHWKRRALEADAKLAAPSDAKPDAKQDAGMTCNLSASSRCPICGADTPHQHASEEIVGYRNGQKDSYHRSAFEEWASPTGEMPVRDRAKYLNHEGINYENAHIHHLWQGWIACCKYLARRTANGADGQDAQSVRDAALEEAANVCLAHDSLYKGASVCADAIRALIQSPKEGGPGVEGT